MAQEASSLLWVAVFAVGTLVLVAPLWLVLLGVYVVWDRVAGLVVTSACKWLFTKLKKPSFRWSFETIEVTWSVVRGELKTTVWGFRWLAPKQFKDCFVELRRCELRLDLRSAYRAYSAKTPLVVPVVEVEGVTVNLERRKGELSLWAALGLSENEGKQAALAAADMMEEEEETPGKRWGLKKLGMFAIERLTIRTIKANVDAFISATDTKGGQPLKIETFELTKQLRHKRGGLYLDELIWKTSMAIARKASADNPVGLVRAAAGAVGDRTMVGVKSTSKGVVSAALNATQSTAVKVHARLAATTSIGAIECRVVKGKHLELPGQPKPSTYVKLQLGRKGVKAKTAVVSSTRNPVFDKTLNMSPVESIDLDLRVQIWAKQLLKKDIMIGATLKIPLAEISQTATEEEKWFEIPDKGEGEDEEDAVAFVAPSSNNNDAPKKPSILLAVRLIVTESS